MVTWAEWTLACHGKSRIRPPSCRSTRDIYDIKVRQRPPQHGLHIWWACRPPTICRAVMLADRLPHDRELEAFMLPSVLADHRLLRKPWCRLGGRLCMEEVQCRATFKPLKLRWAIGVTQAQGL